MNRLSKLWPVLLTIAMLVFVCRVDAQLSAPRVWSDSTGGFKVTASLESKTADTVTLKKADGTVIDVPISRLSVADQDFLNTFESKSVDLEKFAKEYLAMERRVLFAKRIVDVYRHTLSQGGITDGQKRFIGDRITSLETHSQNDSILVKGQFLTPAEIEELKQKSNELIEEWRKLVLASEGSFDSDAFKRAQVAIQEARRVDPISFRADFYLGLTTLFIMNDFDAAEKHFDLCIQRGRDYQALHGVVDKYNFANAMNNLALLRARRNQLTNAESLWQEMLTIVPEMSPEVAHNIERVGKFIEISERDPNKSYLKATPRTRKAYRDWTTELAMSTNLLKNVPSETGWLYLPYVVDKEPVADTKTPPNKGNGNAPANHVLVGSGTGFVISPGFVITNRHVVESDGKRLDSFRLYPDNTDKYYSGQVLAVSSEYDLAIIKCAELVTAGIPLRSSGAKLGEQVLVAGFPLTDILGKNLTVTKGIISQLPNGLHGELVLDAKANPGNSGGPVFDQFGNAVAILNAGYVGEAFDDRLTLGVSGRNAIDFAVQHINGFSPQESVTVAADDAIVESSKGKIIRIEVFIAKDRLANLVVKASGDRGIGAPGLYRELEDKACIVCAGKGRVRCSNKQCHNGQVAKYRLVTITDPSGRWTNTIREKYFESCGVCGGQNHIDCWGCTNGKQDF